MNAIFKNEIVYVLVRNKDIRKDVNIENSENLILCDNELCHINILYGGRVYLKIPEYVYYGHTKYRDYCYMKVDGIEINNFFVNEDGLPISDYELSLEQVTAYLNQIENLGVDSFLENYKLQLQDLKKECETKVEVIRQDLNINYDEEKASFLKSLENFILSITFVIFSLLINMNAGLDNHCYTDAYNTIIGLYF